jgi:hypothetical protein
MAMTFSVTMLTTQFCIRTISDPFYADRPAETRPCLKEVLREGGGVSVGVLGDNFLFLAFRTMTLPCVLICGTHGVSTRRSNSDVRMSI